MTDAKDTPANPADTDTDTADANKPDHAAAPDDIREQMRLALERKKNKQGGGSSGGAAGSGNKASAATSNAKVSREFRRKSGG